MTQRVLITEKIADSGIEYLRGAGFEVDEQLDLSSEALLGAVRGADALIVRSATPVTKEVIEAADRMMVIGRAGIGLDNIDVDTATRRGVMVVNAPQSNVLSAAEHTMALLLAQARNIPQANAELKSGNWNRSKWEGVELSGKTLGIVGLGRVGGLVAHRAAAFGMRVVGYDPYINPERAQQMGVSLEKDLETVVHESDFLSIHLPKTPETTGLINAELLSKAKPSLRIVNTSRGAIVDEGAVNDALREGRIAGAALDVFAEEPTTASPLFELETTVVTPHLGASTAEAQDKAGQTIAEQVVLALRGEFVPFATNLAASEANATVAQFLPLSERLGKLFAALAEGGVEKIDLAYEGEIGSYDCRVLKLGVLTGVLGKILDEPVTFVNAPQLAAERGIEVRETTSSTRRDYVNLITIRGRSGKRDVHIAGTLSGTQETPRIVAIDDHIVDVPPARYMLVVHNDDTPGMIGRVGTALGNAGINISDMALGRNSKGETALMVCSTDTLVTQEVIDALRKESGILFAQAIELDE